MKLPQVSVVEGQLQRRQAIDFTPKWFRGESVFKGSPLTKVFDEMERQDKATGLATLCVASGMGAATIIERV